jgi:single-strand DNA-binding protein
MSDATITVSGNLTADPVLRYSTGGKAMVAGTLAINRRWQTNGQWEEKVSFLGFKAFGQIAENIAASCTKGTRLVVTGRPEMSDWTDKEGNARKSFDIVVDDVGASLKFATATIDRAARDSAGHSRTQPTIEDEEPF